MNPSPPLTQSLRQNASSARPLLQSTSPHTLWQCCPGTWRSERSSRGSWFRALSCKGPASLPQGGKERLSSLAPRSLYHHKSHALLPMFFCFQIKHYLCGQQSFCLETHSCSHGNPNPTASPGQAVWIGSTARSKSCSLNLGGRLLSSFSKAADHGTNICIYNFF